MAQTGEGHGFFANNRLVKICVGLDQFGLSTEADKIALLRCAAFAMISRRMLIFTADP